MPEMWVQSLNQQDPLEKEIATHSCILAWEIPWTEELVGYSLWGYKRVRLTDGTTENYVLYLVIIYSGKSSDK